MKPSGRIASVRVLASYLIGNVVVRIPYHMRTLSVGIMIFEVRVKIHCPFECFGLLMQHSMVVEQ